MMATEAPAFATALLNSYPMPRLPGRCSVSVTVARSARDGALTAGDDDSLAWQRDKGVSDWQRVGERNKREACTDLREKG